ncbi:MAG: 2Fe-2S iron-sulfur cluster-binding protein [Gammaproteobacteria bacterium]|nr:2Fe-2S iron-sulfur cluster-binding protein [Gammaproteobacteria bacterium]
MRKYHQLTVVGKENETPDSVRVSLQVPDNDRALFGFLPGQHLPMQISIAGKPVRRTYSICSPPGELPLTVGIRVQPGGLFSEFVQDELEVGDTIDVMPPVGQFHANVDPASSRTCLAFAAGSGITPVLSIIRATLENEPESRVVLFYGNRRQQTTMFIDDLYALKNRYPERLQLYFLFSQEEQEFDIFGGRLDAGKVANLIEAFCGGLEPDEAFICGPDTMIGDVRSALIESGMTEDRVHSERFGAPRKTGAPRSGVTAGSDRIATVNVIMDGHRKSFDMMAGSENLVDAAAEQGIELPYSCKGGVCATCRTHLRDGEVRMAANYGLEPWEIEDGFVLACQSLPVSDSVTIDYDRT